jgi:hypothetical protein
MPDVGKFGMACSQWELDGDLADRLLTQKPPEAVDHGRTREIRERGNSWRHRRQYSIPCTRYPVPDTPHQKLK